MPSRNRSTAPGAPPGVVSAAPHLVPSAPPAAIPPFAGLITGQVAISTPSRIHDQLAPVLENRPLSGSHYLLTLEAAEIAPAARPGQFVMLRFPGRTDPLLPRPMSVCDVQPEDGTPRAIRILHRVVGKGTALLAGLAPGDRIHALGPLGRPFEIPVPPAPRSTALLLAGGVGVAIFPFLARELLRTDWRSILLFGARAAGDLVERSWFEARGIEVRVATEDGSAGVRGLVTRLLEDALAAGESPDIAYACGPDPMLRAVSRVVNAAGVPCQVSLEAAMGCGIGACLGCVVPVRGANGFSYARVCVEGPTMRSTEVLWE
jgi:dihydroorotate dehydrogenase electron transfer subunit